MKKKNTILLVVDSVFYDKTISQSNRKSPMEFLQKLRNEGLDATRMFSEAPYTEAALNAILGGCDTLKRGGYFNKFDNLVTIMQVFKESGYKTFCNTVQPHISPSYCLPYIDDLHYNVAYDFTSSWHYRFKYYRELYKKNEILSKEEEKVIIDLFEDNISFWLFFLKELKNNDSSVNFIVDKINLINIDSDISKLEFEINEFNKNKKQYFYNFLDLGLDHQLFEIPTLKLTNKISFELKKKVYNKYKKILKKILLKNFETNLLNNKLYLSKDKKNNVGLFKAYLNAVYDKDLLEKINPKNNCYKSAPSMYSTIKHFEKWALNNKNNYFAYIHVDDCHSPEIFYSYDIDDFKRLDEEFENITKFLNDIPRKYYGSLSYDLSLLYADNCIKELYNFLEKNNMLNNTNIAICADHGSSYTFAPYHECYVNNIYRENYHIPFILWSKDIKNEIKDDFYNSKDIPATIIDLAGIKIPKEYDGISLLSKNKRDYVILENTNGGCPDYNRRDFYLGVRNNNYLVVMFLNKNRDFKDGKLAYVFDLKCDKEERNNLSLIKNINNKISKELIIIEKEFNELKKDMNRNNFIK